MIINFQPLSLETQRFGVSPIPASRCIPQWYKDTPPYSNGENSVRILEDEPTSVNSTMKGCMPLFDAFTAGYMVVLSADILVEKQKGSPSMRWRVEPVLVHGTGDKGTADKLPRHGMEYEIGKWIFDYKITTPNGYSCMFSHPLNRNDLPFRTMSGIVDTDSYPSAIHFPFQLTRIEEAPFIIEAGTPICQIIPFKRDFWKMNVSEYDQMEEKEGSFKVLRKISKSYKKQFWNRKEFV